MTLHIAFSLLMYHPSAQLPSDNLLDTARQSLMFTELLPGLSFRNSDDDFGYMANMPHTTGYGPHQADKMVPADGDATSINDPDHDLISDFSRTTHESTGWFSVPTVWETSVPLISRGDIALQKESKDSLTRETEGMQGMRRDRDGSVISIGESMSRRSRRNSTRSHSHQTHREFYSDERDLREHLERRAQQAIHGENSVQGKLYSTEYNMEIQNMERRNSEYALFDSQCELESQKTTIMDGQSMVRSSST